jgi:maltose O-acetyltransferase
MSEREKMLLGEFYNSRDPELIELYHRAKRLLKEYNQLDSDNFERKEAILSEFLEFSGAGIWIESPFYCDYGCNISIGSNTFINTNCIFIDNNKIKIGNNGLIGPFVQIYTATHPLQAVHRILENDSKSRYVTFSKPVTIGENVWIGGGAIILPGVTIGDNVVIGAGSVVSRDVPNNVLALGNPCKIKKEL